MSPIHERTYLVGGEILKWDGTCKTVLSPVCTRTADGEVRQVEIGSYPVMGEAQSDSELDAAVAAYDNGRGQWPTMTVAERIACMQDFVRQMVAQRATILATGGYDPGTGAGSRAVEFVGTSVTSPALLDTGGAAEATLKFINPHFKYIELTKRGYMLLDVDLSRVVCEWWHVDTVTSASSGEALGATYQVLNGANRLSTRSANQSETQPTGVGSVGLLHSAR